MPSRFRHPVSVDRPQLMPTLNRRLKTEYVRLTNDVVYPQYGIGRLDPRDDTAIEYGGQYRERYDIYQKIQRDPHVYAVLQKRISAVVCREWEVKPASESRKDKKAADLVTEFLENLASYPENNDPNETFISVSGGFDNVCAELMQAILYGISFGETMWDQDSRGIFPREIKQCDIRRFTFLGDDRGIRLRLLTPSNPYDGEPIPPRKIIYHRFSVGNLHPDPYGVGLATQLFYPNYFKRNATKFWLIFADKWASPTAVGKYGINATDDEKDTLLALLESIATDSGIVIPENMAVEFLEAQRSSTISTYEGLINFCNNEISKAVLGETGTTDQSNGGGSRARDQVGNEVRIEIAKTDADLLSMTLNRTLCRWITEFNVPGANPPKIWRKFPELENKFDRQAESAIVSTLGSAGYIATQEWVADKFEIELEDPKEAGPAPGEEPDIAALLGDGGTGEQPAEETPPEETPAEGEPVEQPAEEAPVATDLAEPVPIDLSPDQDTLLEQEEWDALAGAVSDKAVIKDAMRAVKDAADA